MPGRDPPQAAVGTLHVGGREIPFMSPIPFLVLSRRGPSPDFQGMGYWSAGLCKQRGKAAASRAPENCVSKFCWGIPEESGCPFQPCGTRSWANASKQAFPHWRYQGSMWYEEEALLMPLLNSLCPRPSIHIPWIFGYQRTSMGKLVGLSHCLL